MKVAFCNYCNCDDCVNGRDGLLHALTQENTYICDVCYTYDVCTNGPNRNNNGPCSKTDECSHRPLLISEFH